MTLTGNPQNMIIGVNSNIGYVNFFSHLFIISIIGLFIIVFIVKVIYRKEFKNNSPLIINDKNIIVKRYGLKISFPIFITVIIFFFLSSIINLPIYMIALAGASLIILTGKIKPTNVLKEVDWVMLLFFASLFILVYGIQKVGLLNEFIQIKIPNDINGIITLNGLSLVLSQIVSNVPFIMVMLPLMKSLNSNILWLSLATGSTIAGNATLMGAMANLIVVQSARSKGVKISFWEFTKVGLIITVITLIFSILILYLEQIIGLV